ncbi:M20/M25/M40 family metallo-hydrolase [Nonlabens ulvanivorans]|uniref:Peptidase M28 n=1 Tax=Nonlabens ulvanivorans TaxID=906888 RepID=A0A084JSR8_NONUL|nr:M20/M25/M40 family metallo-hydrolase [Nonlabens ulvanivorans]KEZ92002.1 peptidase M28 [Nonlabens ulvanivorans]PRX14830.1 peptidase M28-like protein [Nonlabens ulvanivorans]
MKRIVLILSAAVLIASCGSQGNKVAKLEKATGTMSEVLPKVKIPKANASQIAADVSFLASDDLEGRDTGSDGILAAAKYLQNRLHEIGLQPYKGDFFDDFDAKGAQAFNVVGMLPGTDGVLKDEIVVIGAHYDHIGFMKAVAGDSLANGANDNATGTASVLAIAQALKQVDFNRRTVVFALFSAEEKGLLGSKHLAKRMKAEKENVVAMLNFEMIGTPMVGREYIAYITGHDKSNMASVFNAANNNRLVTGKLDKAVEYNLFMRSDNYPFFNEFQVPAQTFSTFDFTNFKYYHQPGDEVSEVNAPHMAAVVDAVMPGIMAVVNDERLKMMANE